MENLMEQNMENAVVETLGAEPVVETPAQPQEPPKTYTQEEVNEIVGKRNARTEAKLRREYEQQYGGLMSVLRAGTGKEDIGEIADTFRSFYGERGVTIPQTPALSSKDLAVLASADAGEIIDSGYEDVVEEMTRLAQKGADGMTEREKAVFTSLAEYRKSADRSRELSQIGVTEDVYNGREFLDFASKFSPNTPISEVYSIFQNQHPKKVHKPMGSMKSAPAADSGVKDFYSYEEAQRFSVQDFNRNPALYKAVVNSMPKW